MNLLAVNQKSKENGDHQGPSLTSDNRDERILARRLRVEQRIEQRRRYFDRCLPSMRCMDINEFHRLEKHSALFRLSQTNIKMKLVKLKIKSNTHDNG
jgi:hypothetical protein